MDGPSSHLIDALIDYADMRTISLRKAASSVVRYAEQRLPEYRIEQQATKARSKVRDEVFDSKREYFIVRVLMKTRIREVVWTYFPDFHVIDSPREAGWYSIRYRMPVWEAVNDPEYHYIDDLFYDSAHEQFWMPEPYLTRQAASFTLYNHLISKGLPTLAGTSYRKINPEIVENFFRRRRNNLVYKFRSISWNRTFRKQPYGSLGWQDRIKVVDKFRRAKK